MCRNRVLRESLFVCVRVRERLQGTTHVTNCCSADGRLNTCARKDVVAATTGARDDMPCPPNRARFADAPAVRGLNVPRARILSAPINSGQFMHARRVPTWGKDRVRHSPRAGE